jgi:16S rRNA (guanine1207-N2)-methyltransferase
VKSDPFQALALTVAPDDDALLIGGDAWPNAIDRRNPKLAAWPQAGQTFATVALRLPKAKDEFAMALHGAAAALKADGALYVFGGNDEGIASAKAPLEALFGEVETATIKHHARVFRARGLKPDAAQRGTIADWRRSFTFESGGQSFPHVTYPGVFAKDRLDGGTALLLAHLPALHGNVLDFGAGSGAISQVIQARYPDVAIAMADIDATALEAARENVPGADIAQLRTLCALPDAAYDFIVSNPPVHTGVEQDFSMLQHLISEAPRLLKKGGRMFLVLQSKVPFVRFAPTAQKIVAEGGYAVWIVI